VADAHADENSALAAPRALKQLQRNTPSLAFVTKLHLSARPD
jgi:hypothetical protein